MCATVARLFVCVCASVCLRRLDWQPYLLPHCRVLYIINDKNEHSAASFEGFKVKAVSLRETRARLCYTRGGVNSLQSLKRA